MRKIKFLSISFLVLIINPLFSQETYKDIKAAEDQLTYQGDIFYPVKHYPQKFRSKRPKNVILMIGDGMGVSHVFAGKTANKGHLFLENFRIMGLSETQSADKYITDSAAGGTALSTGVRTYNGALGVDINGKPLKTILEEAEEKGLSTGLVSTSALTHATPASFIVHQGKRSSYEAIAADFLKTDIDVMIGGGYKHFTERKDKRNLASELQSKGYQVLRDIHEISEVKSGKLAGFTAAEHNGRLKERGDMLPTAVRTAIGILSNNRKGFFMMAEGSQIDWGGHQNDTRYVVEEMLDFDQAIGEALEYAAKDGKTLIIVTSDHETGGIAITDGNFGTGMIRGGFTMKDHSAEWVPVFAYGPGAENFSGIMKNTDIHSKVKKLLLKK